MGALEDRAVIAIHEKFHGLPRKSKPRTFTNGSQEWVPLSGIVVIGEDGAITCLALGTGMKCLPGSQSLLLDSGTVLHDWHAEILAIRAFNYFLLQECHQLASCANYTSPILRRRQARELSEVQNSQPFSIREDLRILMYCSEAPCGDASMELVMEAQADPTPWPVTASNEKAASGFLGRGSFSQLGVVRRKPSRADSPITLSKSCSDKLALKQCTSLLSSPVSLLISPGNAYIDTLILPYHRYRPEACERAFGPAGRMLPVDNSTWLAGYEFRPFRVETAEIDFHYSRRVAGTNLNDRKGSNISAVWTPRHQETLINGVLQGRKQTDPLGASALSRMQIWNLLVETIGLIDALPPRNLLKMSSYLDMKKSNGLEHRRRVKDDVKSEALRGWSNESSNTLFEEAVRP